MVDLYYLQFVQYFVDVTALFITRKGTYETIVKYVKTSLGGQGEITYIAKNIVSISLSVEQQIIAKRESVLHLINA